MSLFFALLSLVLAIADGSDLNPHSKAFYASPCGTWTFRRAVVKSALPLLAAALPNYIHLRVSARNETPESFAGLAFPVYSMSVYIFRETLHTCLLLAFNCS